MTPKKKPLKPRQEKFAKALATGLPLAKAAKKAGYTGEVSSACELAKTPNVSQRVIELREKNEQVLEISRQNFIRTIHARFSNEENRDAPKYGEMLAKACGYNEPEKIDISHNMEVVIRIGGKPVE
jgi:phage terminase small subunit